MSGADAQAALEDVLRDAKLDARDNAFASELVKGTIKMRRALAWSVRSYLHRPWQSLDNALRWTLLMGAYQLLYLNLPPHAVVNESARLAASVGHAGTVGLVNAVLRRLASDRKMPPEPQAGASVETFATWASLPDWIAEHFITRFGYVQAVEVARGINVAPRRAVRVNTERWPVEEARAAMEERGFASVPSRYGIPECVVLRDTSRSDPQWLRAQLAVGTLAIQSEESQLAVGVLDPRPGQIILDVCAGRGTKTGQIAARMRGEGMIVSIDDDSRKLDELRKTLARASLGGVATVAADARRPLGPAVPIACDAAIVDAPCSALGILGRRADARWRKSPDDPARFSAVQSAIVRNVSHHLRDGGRLLYVTCSTHPQEDEEVVEKFLSEEPMWRAINIRLNAPIDRAGPYLLTTPGVDGSDGFFYALLERSAANE